jgi:GntR family transcriptional regulator
MVTIDFKSRVPIFEQIKNQIMELVFLGILKPDDQLPSIRSLAQDLKLNVNTVKRSFQDLESVGVIYTLSGRGSFISENAKENSHLKERVIEETKTVLRIARSNGVTKDEVKMILDEIFDKQEGTKND